MRKLISAAVVFILMVGVSYTAFAEASTISHAYMYKTEKCNWHLGFAATGAISVETWKGNSIKDCNYKSGTSSDLGCSEYCYASDHGYHAAYYNGLSSGSSYGYDY